MKLSYLKDVENGIQKDLEWSEDWQKIKEVYRKIEELEELFNSFDVSYLRELQQKTLILNLTKYAWSLQGLILEKYSDARPDDEDLI